MSDKNEIEILKQQNALLATSESKLNEWKKLNRKLSDLQNRFGSDDESHGQAGIVDQMQSLDSDIKNIQKYVAELESKLPGCYVGND